MKITDIVVYLYEDNPPLPAIVVALNNPQVVDLVVFGGLCNSELCYGVSHWEKSDSYLAAFATPEEWENHKEEILKQRQRVLEERRKLREEQRRKIELEPLRFAEDWCSCEDPSGDFLCCSVCNCPVGPRIEDL